MPAKICLRAYQREFELEEGWFEPLMRVPKPPESRSKRQEKDLFAENEVGGALCKSGMVSSAFAASNTGDRKRKILEVHQGTGVNKSVTLQGASSKSMAKGTRGAASGTARLLNSAMEVGKTSPQHSSAAVAGCSGTLTNNGTSSRSTIQFAMAQTEIASKEATNLRPSLSDVRLQAVEQKVRCDMLHMYPELRAFLTWSS